MTTAFALRLWTCMALFSLFASSQLMAQANPVDSLWAVYRGHAKDTLGLMALEQMVNRHLAYVNPDSAQKVLEKMRVEGRKMKWKRGEFYYYKDFGFIENRRYRLRQSLLYYDSAAQVGNRLGIPIGNVKGNIGGTYYRLQQYDSALVVLHEALLLAQNEPNKRLECQVSINLAASYGGKLDLRSSLNYALKAATLAEENKLNDLLGKAYTTLIPAFTAASDTSKLRAYSEKVLQLGIKENNPIYKFSGYRYLASYWQERGVCSGTADCGVPEYYQKSLDLLDKAEAFLKDVKSPFENRDFWQTKAMAYSALGSRKQAMECWRNARKAHNYEELSSFRSTEYLGYGVIFKNEGRQLDSAAHYFQKSAEVAVAIRNYFQASRAYKMLAFLYTDPNHANFPKAYAAYLNYKTYEDSLLNADKIREMAAAEANFSNELNKAEQEKRILGLQNQKLADELTIKEQTDLLFRNKTEKEKREILLQLLRRDNEIQSFSLRQKDDSISTQQLRLQLEQTDKAAQITALRHQQEADAAQRNRIIAILSALLALGGLAFYIFRLRQKAANARRVAELEMRVLRAQMNPHFLFNSMNAINSYILKNDADSASDYLTRFSKVMRTLLDNVQQPTISLEKELAFLEQYLQVEQKRMQNGFEYHIQVDEQIDPFDQKIPGMILQPFIENAIIHGLRPKTSGEKPRLQIHIAPAENQKIRCSIEDNGVGRANASPVSNGHSSMGLKITQERLNLWHKGKLRDSIRFTDLKSGDGAALGTRVEVLL